MNEKITGYALLAVGLIIIIGSAFNVYQVFTQKAQPVQIFDFEGIGLDTSAILPSGSIPQMQNTTQAPKMELISSQMINETTNLFIHLILMGFVSSVGYKIASLGVMMLRPIVVPVKTKNEQPNNN